MRPLPLIALTVTASLASGTVGWFLHARLRKAAPAPITATLAPAPSTPPARAPRPVTPSAPAYAPPGWDQPPPPMPPRMFRLDPQHTGRSGFSLPRAPGILRAWRTDGRITSQAALLPDGTIVFGGQDGAVYGVRRESNEFRYKLNTGDRVYPSPLVVPGGDAGVTHTYLGSDADRFFAVSPRGNLMVGLGTTDDADTSAVLAPDGTLRFASGKVLYSTDGELNVLWSLELPGKLFSSPAMLPDGTAVLGGQDNRVYAVDARGVVQWRYLTNEDVDATPAIDLSPLAPHAGDAGHANGVVYIGSDDGTLYALEADTGALVWKRKLGGYVRAGVAIGLNGTLVVGTYGPDVKIVGVDRRDGSVQWRVPIVGPPSEDFGIASAALVDREGRFAVGTPDDALVILSPEGKIESRVALPADVDAPPVLLDDGLVAVGCDDGAMYLIGDGAPESVDAGQ